MAPFSIQTPIGNIHLTNEAFLSPEILFTPLLVDVEKPGVAEMIHNCIMESAVDCRMKMFKCIIMSGGSTMFTGYRTRIEKELRQISTIKFGAVTAVKQAPRIVENPNRMSSVFVGAKTCAKVFQNDIGSDKFWFTQDDLSEFGASRLVSKMSRW